jgi:oligosaccharide repeat unit polymerase
MDNSNTVASALALVVIVWTIISVRARSTATLPAILHNLAWAAGLLIVGSGLMRYDPTSLYAWILIGSSILCFNIGIAMAGARPKHHPDKAPTPAPAEREGFLVTRRTYRALLLAFTLGFVIYLFTIARYFGLSTLFLDPESIRAYSDVSYMEAFPLYGKVLFYLGPLCLILTIFPDYVEGLRRRPLAWRLMIMAYLAGAQIAALQRTNLFVAILWLAGMLILRLTAEDSQGQPGRLNARKVLALMVTCVIGLTVFQGLALALGKTGTEDATTNYLIDPRLRDNPISSVLHYASSGIPAFGKLVDSQNEVWPPPPSRNPIFGDYNPQTWGAATFAGPLKLVPGAPQWSEIAPFTFLPVATNVYTWLEPWYRDFRYGGVLFGSFITGFVIGRFAGRSHHSPEAMLIASLLLGFTGIAAFVNRYLAVMSLVLYAAIWGLGVLRRSREKSQLRRQGPSALTDDAAGRESLRPSTS